MSDASATTLATSESIKAYVDSNSGTGGYSLYRTVDARGSASINDWGNWEEILDVGGLGAFNGVNYEFASTGTYLIEMSLMIKDNDTTANEQFYPRVFNGTTELTYTTNNGGTGGLVPLMSFIYEERIAATLTNAHQITFIYKVSDISTDKFKVYAQDYGGSSQTLWEGAGTIKITKISSSLI